mgnify:CR=1 FL=1
MFGLGPTELILIVLVIVLLFGARRIPELMRGLGSGIKEFKQAANDVEKDSSKSSSTSDK